MHFQSAAPTDRQYVNITETQHQRYRKQLILFEQQFKQEQTQFNYSPEDVYYIVSSYFLKNWRDFCLSNQRKRPELPIINEDIIDKESKKMKANLKEKQDFQFLSQKVYGLFQKYKKIDVKRKAVMIGNEKRVPVYLNSYQYLGITNPDLKMIDQKQKKRQHFSLKTVEQSQNANVQQLLKNIAENQQIILKRYEIRLWRIDKKQNLDSLFKYLKVAADRANYQYRIKGFGKLLKNQTKVQDLQMEEGDFFVVQIKEREKKWFLQSENEKKCEGCYDITELKFPCKCQKVAYCKLQCQQKDKRFHIRNCQYAQLEELNKPIPMNMTKNSINGLAGLKNIGNTCFMNSCLQCLSNTMPLTSYFLQQLYEKQINRTNILGTKGKLAKTYAKFIKAMWCDQDNVYNPDDIKSIVSSINPMFSGYAQHDSQEFFSFLIDGLHEDLNRVVTKPYVQSVQSNNRPDKIVAIQSWLAHIKRNQSIITDLMTGQYKSKVTCPTCKIESITFDPFITLTLPIPQNLANIFQGFIFYHNFQNKTKRLYFKYSKPNVSEWTKQISSIAQVNEKNILIYVVSINQGIYLAGRQSLSEMMYKVQNQSKNIFAIQLSQEEVTMKNRVQLSTRFSKKIREYHTTQYENLWFKFPFFFEKQNTNGLTIYKRMLKFLYNECFRDSKHKSFFGGKSYEEYEEKMLKTKPFKIFLRYGRKLQRFYNRLEFKYQEQVQILNQTTLSQLLKKIDEKQSQLDIRFEKSGLQDFNFDKLKDFQDANKKIKLSKQTDQPVDIGKCFETMCQSEQLQAGNQWYCPKCKEHKLANKQMNIYKAPKILIIHLKRFKQKGIIKKEKNQTKVQFPLTLNLNDYLIDKEPFDNYVEQAISKQVYIQPKYQKKFTIKSNQAPIYDLYAVSNHSGGLGGGHYTAYAKNNDKWYHFNDSSVSGTSSSNIVSSSAYMLFYKRKQ